MTEFCKARAEKGVTIFTDPIMGDEGKLYNGITEETIDLMRELISAADYIVPNYTEAAYLTELPYKEDGVTDDDRQASCIRCEIDCDHKCEDRGHRLQIGCRI